MTKLELKFEDTVTEIDIACDKIKTVLRHLLNTYETVEDKEPQTKDLCSDIFNEALHPSGRNTYNFVLGYSEIMTFLRIAFDYVYEISDKTKAQ